MFSPIIVIESFLIIPDFSWAISWGVSPSKSVWSIDSHSLLGLKLSKPFYVKKIKLTSFLGINNLLNEQYFDNIRLNAFGKRYYEPAPDRNFYLGADISF